MCVLFYKETSRVNGKKRDRNLLIRQLSMRTISPILVVILFCPPMGHESPGAVTETPGKDTFVWSCMTSANIWMNTERSLVLRVAALMHIHRHAVEAHSSASGLIGRAHMDRFKQKMKA